MFRWSLPAVTLIAILWAAAGSAQAPAAAKCGPTANVTAMLEGKYSESAVFRGLVNGRMYRLWINPETGTWTVTRTTANGITCLMASGDNGEMQDARPPGEAM